MVVVGIGCCHLASFAVAFGGRAEVDWSRIESAWKPVVWRQEKALNIEY